MCFCSAEQNGTSCCMTCIQKAVVVRCFCDAQTQKRLMKRRLSIFLIIMANMFLLAHAVVPHHHHNSVPVVVFDFYTYGHHRHDHHSSHHHDSPDVCLVTQSMAGAVVRHVDGISLSIVSAVLTDAWENVCLGPERRILAPMEREELFRPYSALASRAPPLD